MRLLFLIVVFFSLVSIKLIAQESNKNDHINTKLSFSKYPLFGQGFPRGKYTPCFAIETNYKISKYFDAGVYLGYSQYKELEIIDIETSQVYSDSRSLNFYGININVHILPIFIRTKFSFVDFYLSPKIGGFYYWNPSTFTKKNNRIDYGIYGGLAVYPFKHWGGFFEYGYGNYVQWRSGLSLKF